MSQNSALFLTMIEGILFHVSKFLEKMVFQLMFEISKCI